MEALLVDLIPHAPQIGLFVRPHIPENRLHAALRDFGSGIATGDVIALYDATLLGNARDGAVFTADQVVFQNNALEPVNHVRYEDIVRVNSRRRLLRGRRVEIDVNRGRATVTVRIDFSGRPAAAEYVARFLHEVVVTPAPPRARPEGTTDVGAVRHALAQLRDRGQLTSSDLRRMLDALGT
jgi:hypothetical protein